MPKGDKALSSPHRLYPPRLRRLFYMMVVDIARMSRMDLHLRLGEALLLLLISAGTYEERPWTVSKAAIYLHEPRQTIDRLTRLLERRGLIVRERRGKAIFLRRAEAAAMERNPAYGAAFNRAVDRARTILLEEDWG